MSTQTKIPIWRQITQMPTLVQSLYPNGKLNQHKRTLTVGNLQGESGQSTVINLDDGWAHEFNGGEHLDIVGVVAGRLGCEPADAIRWLKMYGWLNGNGSTANVPEAEPPAPPTYSLQHARADQQLPTQKQCAAWAERLELDCDAERAANPGVFVYRAYDRSIVLLVVRWEDRAGAKQVRRASWTGSAWRLGGTQDAILPLYRLPELASMPDAPVIICEGEKATNAAGALWPQYAATCPVGGSSPAPTSWRPLQGRDVLVLGDADDAGRSFTLRVQAALDGVAASCRWLEPQDVWESLGGVGVVPKGWDVADRVSA